MPKPPWPRARPIRYCSRRMVRGGSSSRLLTGRLKGAPHFGQIGLPESSSMQLTQMVSWKTIPALRTDRAAGIVFHATDADGFEFHDRVLLRFLMPLGLPGPRGRRLGPGLGRGLGLRPG